MEQVAKCKSLVAIFRDDKEILWSKLQNVNL